MALARGIGLSEQRLVGACGVAGGEGDQMGSVAGADTTGPEPAEAPLDEFRSLVRSAFARARASGAGGESMTTAVLKNRILDLTDRQFSERRYGAQSFLQLLRLTPDLVEVTGDRAPHVVRLVNAYDRAGAPGLVEDLGPDPAPGAAGDWRRLRVRDDLWRAAVDYASGDTYVLDPLTGRARPGRPEEGLPVLPTVTPEQVAAWQEGFVDEHVRSRPEDGVLRERLAAWREQDGATSALPPWLRGEWTERFKRGVVDQLRGWFDQRGEEAPPDLLVPAPGRPAPPPGVGEAVRVRRLRELVLAAVEEMSFEELSALPLPAGVVARLRR